MEETIVQQVLGKRIEDLKYADLERYFEQERSESDVLEFKSYVVVGRDKGEREHLEEVYNTICAMLNSEGGLIVWGAPKGERPNGATEKVFKGELTDVKCNREDDQLNSSILNSLSPMPHGVKHKKLIKGKALAYVFQIPKSPYSPHQLRGKYWARFGASTHVAPHYLVEALMRKMSYPDIRVSAALIDSGDSFSGRRLRIDLTLTNESPLQVDENVVVVLDVTNGGFDVQFSGPHGGVVQGQRVTYNDAAPLLHYGVPRVLSVFLLFSAPGPERVLLSDIKVSIGGKRSPAKYSTFKLEVSHKNKIGESLRQQLLPIKENVMASEEVLKMELKRLSETD